MKFRIIFILCCSFHLAGAQDQDSVITAQKETSTILLSSGHQKFLLEPFDFGQANTWAKSTYSSPFRMPVMDHLPGMFCKLEYKLESKSKLAPRFRLGSLQYTEWMEGKRDNYSGGLWP